MPDLTSVAARWKSRRRTEEKRAEAFFLCEETRIKRDAEQMRR